MADASVLETDAFIGMGVQVPLIAPNYLDVMEMVDMKDLKSFAYACWFNSSRRDHYMLF